MLNRRMEQYHHDLLEARWVAVRQRVCPRPLRVSAQDDYQTASYADHVVVVLEGLRCM